MRGRSGYGRYSRDHVRQGRAYLRQDRDHVFHRRPFENFEQFSNLPSVHCACCSERVFLSYQNPGQYKRVLGGVRLC